VSRTSVRARRRRLSLVTAVAVAGGLWAGPLAHPGRAGGVSPVASHRYVVRQGDTLWAIALRLAPGRDPRPLVDAISAANGVDAGALVPGRTLVIPTG
jgi:nucleoid-associated protein YgaU